MPRIFLLAVLLCASTFAGPSLHAADPAFVGVLALAVDDDIAKQLGLSDETKQKLLDLIEARETEVLDLALEVKNLGQEEQQAKLAPFVAESEKSGLALLTKKQRAELMQLRVARGGLGTLAEPAVAAAIGLSPAQKSNIDKLLGSLKSKLAAGTEAERRVAKAEVERELGKILRKDQRLAWDKLAGFSAADVEEAPAPDKEPGTDPPNRATDDEPTEATEPETTRPEVSKPQPPKNLEDVRLRFNFSYTPWKDVLEWFAKEADLSLVADVLPPGTCNYKDSREYSPTKAIDLMNGMLQFRGYTLVRKERMLFVFDLENGPPPGYLAELVMPEQLDERGDFELVGCIFKFSKLTPEEMESDIRKLIGPQGSLQVLAKTKQLYVTETAARLRAIRNVIKDAEDPSNDKSSGDIATFKLKYKLPEEVMAIVRPLMGIPEGLSAMPDGSLRIAVVNGGLVVKGKPDQVEKFREIFEMADVDSDVTESAPIETPQLAVYPITTADPDAVLQVLRTIMAGQLNVRIDKDPKTGSIVAHATPTQHGTIKAVIEEMQKDTRSFDVIKLRKLDPELVVASLNKALGIVEGAPNTSAPRLVADASQMLVMVFGSKQQIEQVKEAIVKMGETPFNSDPTTSERSYTRSIPLTGRIRSTAIEQFQAVVPAYLPNPIRIVPLSGHGGDGGIPSRVPVPKDFEKRTARPTPASTPPKTTEPNSDDRRGDERRGDDRKPEEPDRRPEGERRKEEDRRTQRISTRALHYVAWQDPELSPATRQPEQTRKPTASDPAESEVVDAEPATPDPDSPPAEGETPTKQKSIPGAEIVITVTPTGIIVSSQDLDALDQVEEMLQQFVDTPAGKEYTIFYLRYAKADVAADLLQQALGGGSADDAAGGGSIMGDLASSMLGGGGGMGGIMGAMMGGGGGGAGGSVSSGPVLLIPDNRLNAVLAQGKPADLDLAEQLLKIIDQQASDVEVRTVAKPRFIPVLHTTADEMATTIRQVYANRMQADPGQQRQPSPQELIQALRGGGRGGRGGGSGNDRKSEEQKMTVGVDAKSNSLIVSAPPALYEEVKAMVEELDTASSQKDEVVMMHKSGTNPLLIERSLTSILGDGVTITRMGSETSTTGTRTPQQRNAARPGSTGQVPNAGQPQFNPQQMQNMMQSMQRGGQGGGGGQRGGGQGGGAQRGGGR